MTTTTAIVTERDPNTSGSAAQSRPKVPGRTYQPPDAANPGPIARFYPVDGDQEDGSAGFDSFDNHDSQNQDRI